MYRTTFNYITAELIVRYFEIESQFLKLIRESIPALRGAFIPKKVVESIASDLLRNDMLGSAENHVDDMLSPRDTILSKAFSKFIDNDVIDDESKAHFSNEFFRNVVKKTFRVANGRANGINIESITWSNILTKKTSFDETQWYPAAIATALCDITQTKFENMGNLSKSVSDGLYPLNVDDFLKFPLGAGNVN